MPRRHRSARDREAPADPLERPRGFAPEWAHVDGYRVQQVAGEKGKTYRCPGCNQEIHPGVAHMVVMPDDDLAGRRHWHSPCWKQELRRLGHRV
jgi:hypothetical protein